MAETEETKRIVYKRYEDGFIVRKMLPEDGKIVQHWFFQLGIGMVISRADLDVTLSSFPKDCEGFYIGEYQGKVVASAIRIPWGKVYYGSYYYVDETYRGKGFGTRLRDQVAREYVGNNICCIDAVLGTVTEKNLSKFGYILGFKTGHFRATAKKNVVQYASEIKKATDVSFDNLIEYDNKNFICPNVRERREFLKQWIDLPEGAAFVSLDESGKIVGLGCRRICMQENSHTIGPLYADNLEIGNSLMQRMMEDIEGSSIEMNICYTNEDALKMVELFGFKNSMNFQRMYLNADPGMPKKSVLAVTSLDVCGF